MNELELSWVINRMPKSDDRYLEIMSLENVEKARQFHKSFPQYTITAMANLKKMADYLGLGSCWIQGRMREAEDGRSTEDYLRELLGFPAELKLEAVLAVGVAESHPDPYTTADLKTDHIIRR